MKREILTGAGVLIAAVALCAQDRVAAFQFAGAGAEGKTFGIDSIGGQVVAGKPFSATEERHSLQVLGDGTRIENSETNRVYRDDQGRTRVERSNGVVTIFDPVAGFSAELNPSIKTAAKTIVVVREGRIAATGHLLAKTVTPVGTAVLRSQLTKLREELVQRQTQYAAESPQIRELKAQIADLEKAVATQGPAARFYFSNPAESTGGGLAQMRTLFVATADGPVVLSVAPGDNASVESLPAQMVNGALAQGTRTTETIPVGKIGNDRPISIVNERWFSSDLQMLVKSTSSDARFGDTTYQMANIVQAAPDPSLFQIPADYTIGK